MRYPPCKKTGTDCKKRHPGCHSSCKEFKEYEELVAQDRATRMKIKAAEEDFMASSSMLREHKKRLKRKK